MTDSNSETGAWAANAPAAVPNVRVNQVRVNLRLSAATHVKVKVWCARKGVSMQDGLARMIDKAFESVEV